MAGKKFEGYIDGGTFDEAKRFLFNPEADFEPEIGLLILDALHEKGELTRGQLAWLRKRCAITSVPFQTTARRSLPAPPPQDRFWWYDQNKTPEEQIARDREFDTSYTDR